MMSYEQWLDALLTVVRHTASREYQEQNWFRTDIGVIWPDEVYNDLDDLAFDLFFEKYAAGFTPEQVAVWNEFKKLLEKYGEKMPKYPDAGIVFNDPEWQRVREAASRFVTVFEQKHPEPSVAGH
ncbi:MAG: hypothetical protein WBX22_17155 [Silvibacterium sp.]